MPRYRSFRDIDWPLLVVTLVICALGVIQIFSATHDTKFHDAWWKQIVWIALGVGLMWLVASIDYHTLLGQVPLFYTVTVGALLFTVAVGTRVFGSKRWISIAGMNLHLHAFKGRAARVLALLMPFSTRQSARGGLAWALATISLPGLAAPAWITGQDVRMRSGPGAEHGVITLLQKGDQVDRGNGLAVEGFCRVEKEARSGYVSCQFLSDAMVRRPRAGQDGVPADWRWVSGTQVLLRSAPSPQADVRARLAINRIVRLADAPAQGTYCEVQPLDRQGRDDGPSGFTACQMLAIEPLDQFRALSGLDASGKPAGTEPLDVK